MGPLFHPYGITLKTSNGDVSLVAGENITIWPQGNQVVVSAQFPMAQGVDLPGSINANQIGNGTVSNTEFEYLNGLTGNIQTQLNSKGSVSNVSVVTANGFAGSVATPTTTPAITVSTTVTGLLKGNGTAVSAAVLGADYGNVVGPASSTDTAIARYSGTTGKVIQDYASGAPTVTSTGVISVPTNINVSNGGTNSYSVIGQSILNTGTPTNGQDNLIVGAIGTASSVRGMASTSIYNGPNATDVVTGLNGFAIWGASATASSSTTTNGGGVRNRYIATNSNTTQSVAQMSAISSQIATAGTVINGAALHAESPTVTGTLTNSYGLWVRGGAVTGTVTNRYGTYIDSLTGGTNRWGVYQAGTADPNYFAGNSGFGSGNTAPTALVDAGASTASIASMRVRSGTAPAAPNDGDIWNDSTQNCLIAYKSGKQGLEGVLFTNTNYKQVTATANTEISAVPTAGIGSMTIPGNLARPGKILRAQMSGTYQTPGIPGAVTVKVKLGSVILAQVTVNASILAANSTVRELWGYGDIVYYTTGTTGTVVCNGELEFEIGSGTVTIPFSTAGNAPTSPTNTATVNTTIAQLLDITETWTTTDAAQGTTITITSLEVLN